ncbi:MAG: galactokinase [Candidatus Coatesbacteria bacterium]
MLTAQSLRQAFVRTFGDQNRKIALTRSPGRINVIGEHVDYNEGFVLPAAVNRAVWVAAQRRLDSKVVVFSATVDEKIEFDLKTMRNEKDHGWANYPKAVLHTLQNRGWKLEGLNLYIESDVPMGGGMSSSAALECAVAWGAMSLFPYTLDKLSVVKICQRAENAFVGVNCGIMDQYASVFGKQGHALFLDCRTLQCQPVPLPLATHRLLVIDSMVKRKLVSGEYNKRREQCAEAVKALKARFPQVKALRDLEEADLAKALPLLPPVVAKRAEHVVRECARVKAAVAALRAGNLKGVGALLNASHESLKTLYEVSCPELDLLVGTAQRTPGVLGARMMGGGFGGCAIALVETPAVDLAKREVSRVYQHRFGTTPPFHDVEAADGTSEVVAPS